MFTDRSVLCPSCNKLCTGAKSGTKGDAPVGMTSIVLDTPTWVAITVQCSHVRILNIAKHHSARMSWLTIHTCMCMRNALLIKNIFNSRWHFHHN